jgi:hypothetical protein
VVGTWSSITVLTSFVFGIVVFKERVKNLGHTSVAFALLIAGLIGMARYSSSSSSLRPPLKAVTPHSDEALNVATTPAQSHVQRSNLASNRRSLSPFPAPKQSISVESEYKEVRPAVATTLHQTTTSPTMRKQDNTKALAYKKLLEPLEMEPLFNVDETRTEDIVMNGNHDYHHNPQHKSKKPDMICGIPLTRRQTGILGAVVNGAWGGLNLIPLHYALQDGFSGAGYLISYATGSLLVNIFIWIAFLAYYYITLCSNGRKRLMPCPSFTWNTF